MSRMKKGQIGHERAVERWRQTMLKKYGGEDGLRKKMQARGRKGGSVIGTQGGFASELIGLDGLTGRQRARIAGAKGGKISRKGKAKYGK